MADLLDAMPDSVMICSKDKGQYEKMLKAHYSNRKMKSFFGYDPTNQGRVSERREGWRQKGLRKLTPLQRKVFTPYLPDQNDDDQITSRSDVAFKDLGSKDEIEQQKTSFSLLDIIRV